MEEGGWASLPHGTILRILSYGKPPHGKWLVVWVDHNGHHPRQVVRHLPMNEVPDEVAAYARFVKEQNDGHG